VRLPNVRKSPAPGPQARGLPGQREPSMSCISRALAANTPFLSTVAGSVDATAIVDCSSVTTISLHDTLLKNRGSVATDSDIEQTVPGRRPSSGPRARRARMPTLRMRPSPSPRPRPDGRKEPDPPDQCIHTGRHLQLPFWRRWWRLCHYLAVHVCPAGRASPGSDRLPVTAGPRAGPEGREDGELALDGDPAQCRR
jgi:hypothetical protein